MSPHRSAPKPKTALSLRDFHALFPDEAAARAWFEAARWPYGPVCPRCAAQGRASWMHTRDRWVCRGCLLQYSVMSFTPMHRSHLPLLVWAQAMHLILTSSKGVSSLKLSQILGISYKAAWHLTQRIRLMIAADVEAGVQAGGGGHGPLLQGLVEIDETYAGAPPRKRAAPHPTEDDNDTPDDDTPPPPSGGRKTGRGTPRPMVLVAIERSIQGAGGVCTSGRSIAKRLPTHSREAVASETAPSVRAHVNTAESWCAVLHRAVVGVFHHLSTKHLERYASEAAFRWNTRAMPVLDRMRKLVAHSAGKSLTFQALVGGGLVEAGA